MPSTTPDGLNDGAAELHTLLMRVVAFRVSDPHDRDDIVQEAIARTLEVQARLSPEALVAYAVTVARNLTAAHYRSKSVTTRNQSRLYDPVQVASPEEVVVEAESGSAVRAAVIALPDTERLVLLGHVHHGKDTAALATDTGGTAGGVAARLARARARARVDYVLAIRHQDLPTAQCRSVLLAISAADSRRQRALNTSEHLLDCPVCPNLVRPLAERRSVLAGLLPVPILIWLARARSHPALSLTAATGTTVAVAAGFALLHGTSTPAVAAPTIPKPPSATVSSPPVRQTAEAITGSVTDVSAPYGFWMRSAGTEVYVVFDGLPRHPVHLNERISLTKTQQRPVTAALLASTQQVSPDDRQRVKAAGHYLSLKARDIRFIT